MTITEIWDNLICRYIIYEWTNVIDRNMAPTPANQKSLYSEVYDIIRMVEFEYTSVKYDIQIQVKTYFIN